ncbi:MAG: ABC transporter permease [Eubacterium sp.]|nr:ABC transporter permease [Eubacterium sp.]
MSKIVDFCRRNLAWVLLLVICIIFSFTSQNFFTVTNILNILNQNAYIIICTYGIALIMMSGGLDMAVGYQMSICGVVCALMITQWNVPVVIACVITIVMSIIFGALGTLLEQLLQLPRIFVSIGLSTVYQGVAYVITNSKTISGLSDSFKQIGQGTVLHPSLTWATIMMIICGFIMSFIMDRTYFGRYVFALGGNEAAARLAGINVKRMKYAIGCIAGFFCGVGAIILTSRVGAAAAGTAAGTEITILTGVLVGGVSVRGGDGKIANCIAGVLIMGLLTNGMQLAGLNTYYQYIAKGTIMLLVMWFDAFQIKRRAVAANKRKEERQAA